MTRHVTLAVLAAVVALSAAANSAEPKSSDSARALNPEDSFNELSITNTEARDTSSNNRNTSRKGLETENRGSRVMMKYSKTNKKLPFRRKGMRLQRRVKLESNKKTSSKKIVVQPIKSMKSYGNDQANLTLNESEEKKKLGRVRKLPGRITKLLLTPRNYSRKLSRKLEKILASNNSGPDLKESKLLKNESTLTHGKRKFRKFSLGIEGNRRFSIESDEPVLERVKSERGGPSPPASSHSKHKSKLRRLRKRIRTKKTGLLVKDVGKENSKLQDSSSYPIYSAASRPPLKLIRKKKKKYIGLIKKAEPEQPGISDEDLEKELTKGKSHLSGGNSFAVSYQHTFVPPNFASSFGPPRPSTLRLHPSPPPPNFSSYLSPSPTYFISDIPPNFIDTAPVSPGLNYGSSLNPLNHFDFARLPPVSVEDYGPPRAKPSYTTSAPDPTSHPSYPSPGRGQFNSPPLGTPPPSFEKPSPMTPAPALPNATFGSYSNKIQQLKLTQTHSRPAIIDAIPPRNSLTHSNLRFKNKQPMLVPNINFNPNVPHSSYSHFRTRSPRQNLRQNNFHNIVTPRVTPQLATRKPFISSSGPIAVSQQLQLFPGLNQPLRKPDGQSYRPITRKPSNSHFSQAVPISRHPSTTSQRLPFTSANSWIQQNIRGTDEPALGSKESNINDINTISEQINKFHSSHEILSNFNDINNIFSSNKSNTLPKLHDEVSSSLQIQRPPHSTKTQEVELQTTIPASFPTTKFDSAITPKWTATTRGTTAIPPLNDNVDLPQHGLNSLPVINTFHRLKLDKLAPPFPSIGPDKQSQETGRKFSNPQRNVSLNSVVSVRDGSMNPQTTPLPTQTLRPILELKDLLLTEPRKINSILKDHFLKPFTPTFAGIPGNELLSPPKPTVTFTETPSFLHSVKSSSEWLSTLKPTKVPMIRPTPLRTSTPTSQRTKLRGPDLQFPATTYRPPTTAEQINEQNTVINQLDQLIDLILAKENSTNFLDSLRLLSPFVSKPLPPHTPRTTHTRGKFRNLFHSNEVFTNDNQVNQFSKNEAIKKPGIKHSPLRHFESRKPFKPPHSMENIWAAPLRINEHNNNETKTIESQLALNMQNHQPEFQTTLLSSPAPSADFFNEHFQASSLPNVPQSPHLVHQSIGDAFEASQLRDLVRLQGTPMTHFALNTLHGVQESIGHEAAAGTIAPNATILEMVLNPLWSGQENMINNVDLSKIVEEAPLPKFVLNSLSSVNPNTDTKAAIGLSVRNKPANEFGSNSIDHIRGNLRDEATFVPGDEIIFITQDETTGAIPTSLLDMIDFSKFQGRSFIFVRTNGHEYSVIFPMSEQQQELGRAQLGTHDIELRERAPEVDKKVDFSSQAFAISTRALAAIASNHDLSLNFAGNRRSSAESDILHHLHPPRRDKNFQ